MALEPIPTGRRFRLPSLSPTALGGRECLSHIYLLDAVGMGQESSLVSHSAGGLHAPVLATLAESLYIGGGTEKVLTS